MNRSLYVVIPLMAVLTILQATVLARLPVFDIFLQPAALVVIAWGLLRGPYEGLIWAFIAGIALDLFSIGPTGSTALALMLTVLPLTYIKQLLPENPYLFPILLSGLGIALFLIVYSLILALAQLGFRWNILVDLPLTMIINALLAIPIYWLLRWLTQLLYPRQIEM